jgi:glycosyltransferase involved in cell wall biosynthesis
MTNKPVSIIIPVYNIAPYLKHCLDSIILQTFKNTEIIIVNDCSTDGSGDIIT